MAPASLLALLLLLSLSPSGRALHRCWPGTVPGGFHTLQHGVRTSERKGTQEEGWFRLEGERGQHLQLSQEDPAHPFGSNWHSYDDTCPLENLLRPHLEPGDFSATPATIVLIGDSIDCYFVDFVCGEAEARGVRGWKAFVHSHTLVNYCFLPSGLRILQIYILRFSVADDLSRLETMRRLFTLGEDDVSKFDGTDRASLEGRTDELAVLKGTQPDLVVFASAYWVCQHFAGGYGGASALPTPYLLPSSVIESYKNSTLELLFAARAAFPKAQLALHTSPGLRTDSEQGTNVTPDTLPRIWGKKSYFAQLNAALRVIAQAGHAKLVDVELMAQSLTHSPMLTLDDLHPRSFFSLEVVNVYLNMVKSHALT